MSQLGAAAASWNGPEICVPLALKEAQSEKDSGNADTKHVLYMLCQHCQSLSHFGLLFKPTEQIV